MFSRFFIERPIFANVIAIVTILIGAVALFQLPVAQYPEITPPTVQVTTSYPGASAKIVADTIALPIEQQVNGVENMLYMQSTSSSDGSYKLIVTFEVGTDLDFAQVLVQNRVAIAMASLPPEVQQQGVTTKKVSTAILQVITLTSPDNRYDSLYMTNYALINLRDIIARLPGVGDVVIFGIGSYSMRIWLDPHALQTLNLTASDVISAVQGQNLQVAAGQIGSPPAPSSQSFQYTVNVRGRLDEVEEFENIIVKGESGEGGRLVRVKDVARVELGAQTYSQYCENSGKPSAGIAIYQLPGANALAVAKEIRKTMENLSRSFPAGLDYSIPFDTTLFVNASINEVYETLYEAALLVLFVIMVFLQDWRAMLVPATTVPVTIIGAFIAMAAFGFTVNIVTLFALILAIGIVVDDAIVIVEGAAHGIEQGLSPKDAAIKAMSELTGPILGITLVLMSVFLPAAFIPGVTGQLYRQFALVIAATAFISAVNALTLKPTQCALYLKPRKGRLNIFYRAFNYVYDRCENGYAALVGWMVRRSAWMMILFLALIVFTGWSFMRLPTGFLPTEDQGYVIVGVQLPNAASLERTKAVTDQLNQIFRDTPGIADWITIGGISLIDNSATLPNAAAIYVVLEDWEKRGPDLNLKNIYVNLTRQLQRVEGAIAFVVLPPAIQGLGVSGGFQMQIQLKGGSFDFARLGQIVREMIRDGGTQTGLRGLTTSFSPDVPQIDAEVDRTKAETLEVPVNNVFSTLQAYLGSYYVNQFNKFGRTFQVYVQADSKYRLQPDDIERLYTRNKSGEMVPIGTLTNISYAEGPAIISLYNLFPTAPINGSSAAGFSSGEALKIMEHMAAEKLPADVGYEWTGMSYQEKLVGNQAVFVFALSVLLVFLVLSAQYESWTNPAAVILVVPLALLGTVLALALRGFDNNVYTQIGIVLLIALASKNAILIVEYAREQRAAGRSLIDAAVEASRRRFRPILMTSFAFILGVVPLALATGAGAASRQALGTAVIGGMLASTLLAVLFVPVFYVVMQRFSEWRSKSP
ncbi:efflux RND transporter permease subunit [Desulfoferrobacter suflitae]|uniref:efflux RND transporter permease subunit n=1 Tax=Desulfoferrobacter suflitae TaxID=2865782 RepID=UPI0021643FE7|nr:multidrug efflux RND transporter permease subunit [Desulfoferrobacter suflitae]MCK8601542.1 multidrug efflux RND transporter permease subunit [Desulfoferrobacter suflitae]